MYKYSIRTQLTASNIVALFLCLLLKYLGEIGFPENVKEVRKIMKIMYRRSSNSIKSVNICSSWYGIC